LQDHIETLDKDASPVLVRVLIHRPRNPDALIREPLLDRRRHLSRVLWAIVRDANINGTELAAWHAKAFHPRAAHKENSLPPELRRRHKGMAHLAGDREGAHA